MAETFTPDNLIAGDYPAVTESVTVASGQTLSRGAVLGKVTATGKVVLSMSAAADGSQTPYAILAEDVDASAADQVATAYLSGEFNEGELTFGADHTADTTRAALRDLGVYLKKAV